MCPEKAKVVIFEDDNSLRSVLKSLLTRKGHFVVGEGASGKEALEVIERFDELEVDIALMDADLEDGNTSGDILATIREKAPHVRIIGISAELIEGVDVNVTKKM